VNRSVTLLVALAIVGSAACSGGAPADPAGITLARANVQRAPASNEDAAAAARAVNAFGLDLYLAARSEGDNLVLSPTSIALALAMARAGAKGGTAVEMDLVLRDAGADANADWLNALDRVLTDRSGMFRDSHGEEREVTLRIANAPFAQAGMAFEPAYLESLASRFGAGLRQVDYIADTEGARRMINEWVSRQTEQRIPELLQPGVLDEMTRLTLVNAIYLKAPWLTPFPVHATAPGPFTLMTGATIDLPMMSLTGHDLPYAEGPGWRAVELPYIGGSLALAVMVPDDLAAFEANLAPDAFAGIVGALQPRAVALTFPKFGIETQVSLSEILAALGMPTAFLPGQADFSGITADVELYIDDVVHQANIDVDEAGTEAAAATAVVMAAEGAPVDPPVTLQVDRPFLFALRDLETGAIVFLGRVMDPSVER
jgi:serine protease inhibitor